MSAEFSIQKAFYEAVTGLGLTAYDVTPQQADGGDGGIYPYVAIGAIVLAPWDTKDSVGFDFVARLHTRSRSGSMKESKDIQSAMYLRLHLGQISVTDFHLVQLRRETSDVERAADGSFHGICEYRGLIEYAP